MRSSRVGTVTKRRGMSWFVLVALALAAAPPAMAASAIPRLDYAATCRQTPAVGMNQQATIAGCMKDETAARGALSAVWTKSGKQSRDMCLAETTQGGLPSYVELLTCLQGQLMTQAPR